MIQKGADNCSSRKTVIYKEFKLSIVPKTSNKHSHKDTYLEAILLKEKTFHTCRARVAWANQACLIRSYFTTNQTASLKNFPKWLLGSGKSQTPLREYNSQRLYAERVSDFKSASDYRSRPVVL